MPVNDVSPLPTGEELADITALLHTCLLEVYGEDVPVEYLADAFYHTYRCCAGCSPANNPLKRGFFWLVEPLFGGRGFITGHISPRKLAPDTAGRLDRPLYRHRASRRRRCLRCCPRPSAAARSLWAQPCCFWLDKYTDAEFAEKIGSMSYTAGPRDTRRATPPTEKETTTYDPYHDAERQDHRH